MRWLLANGIDTAPFDPGKPWQYGTGESLNGKFRDECLNVEWFRSRPQAAVVEAWRQRYNIVNPVTVIAWHRRQQPPSQTWRAFLANPIGQGMAADFFVAPTATRRLLFVLQKQRVVPRSGTCDRFQGARSDPVPTVTPRALEEVRAFRSAV